MIIGIVEALGPWTWWVVGLLLLILEVVAPGSFFLWFGVAALIVGTLALLVDLSWQVELILFAVLSIVLVVVGRRFFANKSNQGEQPLLNQRTARLIGRSYVLVDPIVEGKGRIRVDDTTWRVSGPDLPAGTRVTIVGAEGALLQVEADRAS